MGMSVNDSRLSELARMIGDWPGRVAGRPEERVEDSLVLLGRLEDARRLVDVGSGGGLPGLPLKVARPDLAVTLVEADQAKAAFLVQACARLGLHDVDVLARRAEEGGRAPPYRGAVDVALARALAPSTAVVEVCLPLLPAAGRRLAQTTVEEVLKWDAT